MVFWVLVRVHTVYAHVVHDYVEIMFFMPFTIMLSIVHACFCIHVYDIHVLVVHAHVVYANANLVRAHDVIVQAYFVY